MSLSDLSCLILCTVQSQQWFLVVWTLPLTLWRLWRMIHAALYESMSCLNERRTGEREVLIKRSKFRVHFHVSFHRWKKGRAGDNKKERDDFISKIWWWRRLPVNPPSSSQPEWNTSAKSTALHHWRRLKSHVTHQRKSIEKVFLFFSLLRTLVYSNIRPFRLHEHNSIISPNQRYWNPIAIYFLAKWNWSKLFLITPMLLSIWCFNFVHSQQHYIV